MSTPTQKYNKLAGKHVLIIGGTSGIGFAVAEASIESSARVTISSSRPTSISSALTRLTTAYPSCAATIRGFPCDLSTPDVEKNIESLFSQVGQVDHIVFTAGDPLAIRPLASTTLETILSAGQIRFAAPLLVAKVAIKWKYLSPSPESSLTLTTGSVSLKPHENWSVVAGYAAGLHGTTRNLALDLKPVRVNLVSPGAVDTELWGSMGEEAKRAYFEMQAGKVPTGRVGRPEDVAECYLWLMKDSNVTGAVVQSDSGMMLV